MLIDKNNIPIVAMEFMNDVHGEDIDIINSLFELIVNYEQNPSEENKITFNQTYQEWIEHTMAHFQREEKMMEEKRFPPYPFHKGEHDRALEKMHDIFHTWEKTNDIGILKIYFIEELPLWLENHIKSMDTVTAIFFRTGLSPCAIH